MPLIMGLIRQARTGLCKNCQPLNRTWACRLYGTLLKCKRINLLAGKSLSQGFVNTKVSDEKGVQQIQLKLAGDRIKVGRRDRVGSGQDWGEGAISKLNGDEA